MLLHEKRIFIADDDENVLDAMAMILEEEGATVVKGKDGDRLFSAVALGKPDLIITDLYMPNTDGFESISAIKEDLLEMCPILVVTGHPTEENIIRAEEIGASDFIAKPFKANTLVQTAAKLINDHHAEPV